MHELSIVQALLERVELEAQSRGATAVRRLYVRVGELSGVEADLLATAFETFRAGSRCERADLLIQRVPVRWDCPRCGAIIAHGEILQCPTCAAPARLREGGEVWLDRIEMEVPDV